MFIKKIAMVHVNAINTRTDESGISKETVGRFGLTIMIICRL